jgi:hypothetical protein
MLHNMTPTVTTKAQIGDSAHNYIKKKYESFLYSVHGGNNDLSFHLALLPDKCSKSSSQDTLQLMRREHEPFGWPDRLEEARRAKHAESGDSVGMGWR